MKILIAEKRKFVSDSLKKIVRTVPGLKIIDEVSDGFQAFEKIKTRYYDIVVLDANLDGIGGLDILSGIKENKISTRALIYSVLPNEEYARMAFRNGAAGYFNLNSANDVLEMAVYHASMEESKVKESKSFRKVSNGFDFKEDILTDSVSENQFKVRVNFENGKSTEKSCALTVHLG
jgi:DNA-binding NarL/FixJ family response regulator